MQEIDLIIFDLDGTLVDSAGDIVNSVNFALKELGMEEKSSEEIKRYIGTGIEDLLTQSTGREDLYESAHAAFKKHFTEHCLDTTSLYPNVQDTLVYFSGKTKAIVTNRKKYSAERVLSVLGVADHFVNILGSDNVKCTKPDSCPIDRTLAELNIKRDKAIMVGDMDVDVQSGKAAGILTCAVTYGIGDKDDIIKSSPDFMIDGIEELKEIIC